MEIYKLYLIWENKNGHAFPSQGFFSRAFSKIEVETCKVPLWWFLDQLFKKLQHDLGLPSSGDWIITGELQLC